MICFYVVYQGPTTGCPREPWHDLHCRIEGPAAYDVLQNFEERWLRASKPRGLSMTKFFDVLLKVDKIPDILGVTDARYTSEKDPEGWHIQVIIKHNKTACLYIIYVHLNFY